MVEGDPRDCDLLARYLEGMGLRNCVARGGEAALKILEQAGTDLVLLDCRMPGRGGLQCLERVTARYRRVPVIMVSATKSLSVVMRARELGAAGYLIKPYQMSDVRKQVIRVIQKKSAPARGSVPTRLRAGVPVSGAASDSCAQAGVSGLKSTGCRIPPIIPSSRLTPPSLPQAR
ncbi:MAG: response regulator [Phycisphaerales bacterium]|nr:MAG: response regulator [Phycisphaerales bacterium]